MTLSDFQNAPAVSDWDIYGDDYNADEYECEHCGFTCDACETGCCESQS